MKPKAFKHKPNVIHFLPNLFTTANLFCGFYSIIASLQDLYLPSATAIFIAGIFDLLDGRVARLTKGGSKFGEEYDSLSDLVSFGIAPAMLMYLWSIESFGRMGWLACFVFIACGALRLARFNVKTATAEKAYFEGLPIPVAAFVIATTILLFHELMLEEDRNYFNLGLTVVLGFLMVSSIKYRSFKDLDFKDKRSFGFLVFVVFVLMIVAYNHGIMMFVVMMGYVVSGPIFHLLGYEKKIPIPTLRPKKQEELPPNLMLIENKE